MDIYCRVAAVMGEFPISHHISLHSPQSLIQASAPETEADLTENSVILEIRMLFLRTVSNFSPLQVFTTNA